MFLASARPVYTALPPLGAPHLQQQQQPPPLRPAWSFFGNRGSSSASNPWVGTGAASSVFSLPFAMSTPSPPPAPAPQQQQLSASTGTEEETNPSFSFNFSASANTATSGTEAPSNLFAVPAPSFLPTEDQQSTAHPARRRESKFAPLLRRNKDPEAERRKRRDAYMAEVRERRDAALWETRGESSLQRDFFDEQRAWEQQQAREAEAWMPDPSLVDDAEAEAYIIRAAEADDAIMTEEEQEMLPELDTASEYGAAAAAAAWDEPRSRSSFFGAGSDFDDEYEALMLEMAAQAEGASASGMQTQTQTQSQTNAYTHEPETAPAPAPAAHDVQATTLQTPQQHRDADAAMSGAAPPLSSPGQGMDMSLG